MEEIINNQEDLEDAEENKLSESSFKTISDPTVILPQNGMESYQDLKNINPIADAHTPHKRNKRDSARGLTHRSKSNKELNNLELNILPITHVTLNLSVVNKKTTSTVHWRHNFVIKKANSSPHTNNSNNSQTASLSRSNSVYSSKPSKEFISNQSQQSDYSDNNFSTPDFTKSKSTIIKSRDSSALSYHITDYKNFEHNRHSLTLQQQQQQKLSANSRQQTPQQQQHNHHQHQSQHRFMDASNRPISYIDIIRSKSSTGESCSSVCSVEAPTQRMQRHNYSIAEFNKFKTKLLKNHSRNYFIYDNSNLNNKLQRQLNQPLFQFQPVSQPHDFKNGLNKEHLSQIKSIYETIQRANNLKKQSVIEMRRMNYLNSIKNTHEVLSNSLSVTKLN